MEYSKLQDEGDATAPLAASKNLPPPATAAPSKSSVQPEGSVSVRKTAFVVRAKSAVAVSGAAGGQQVFLSSTGQHTLVWEEPLVGDATTIPPGQLNLYTYPGEYSGKELALLRSVLLELSTAEFFTIPDTVGAFPIHALLVCNTRQSLELSMTILQKAPKLLLQTHMPPIFTGEGVLHILCANRREHEAIQVLNLAQAHLSGDEARAFLAAQATGVFFESPPMVWYGESVLSYACVFGLRELVRRLLDTGIVSLDTNPGALTGFYPIHAVSANGNRGMFDYLVAALPAELRANKWIHTDAHGKLSDEYNLDGMSPLQLSAKRGVRIMFQHIMKRELTTVLWTWGPVTQYQVSLDGIDSSSGTDDADVMEVLVRDDATLDTQEFMLDDFMQGFLYTLYIQKWAKFGWYMHYALRLLDFAIVITVAYLANLLKRELVKESFGVCKVLLGLLAAFVCVEVFLGGLYAYNFKRTVTPGEKIVRTWAWMRSFGASINLLAILFLTSGIALYFSHASDPTFVGVAAPAPQQRALSAAAAAAATSAPRHLQGTSAEHALLLDGAHAAAIEGQEPLVWLLMGLGFMIKFYAFVDQFVQPYISLSIFVLSIRKVVRGEFLTFMSIFLVFLAAATFTMITIFPQHPAAGPLPQAPDFGHWGAAIYAILMVGFTGEPLDLNLDLEYFAPLGYWQKVCLAAVGVVYVLFIFASLILLLNLLIALLGSSFSETSEKATLQGRVAFATVVLRLELVAHFLGINTFAGEPSEDGSGVFVHKFRSVVRDPSGELPRHDTQDENVFDKVEDARVLPPPAADADDDAPDPLARLTKVESPSSLTMFEI